MRRPTRSSALGAALLATCAAAAGPALAGDSARHRTAEANHHAAFRDAAQLLQTVQLPADAAPASMEPSGDQHHLAHAPAKQTGDVVDRTAWWTARETPEAVLRYVRSHPPAHAKFTMSGQAGQCEPHHFPPTNCQTTMQFIGFTLPPVPRVLGTRWLLVAAARLADGSTGVRVDAEVQWLIPRPTGERVPSGVQMVDVVRPPDAQHQSVSRHVEGRAQVRQIIRLIDRLPVLQPGVTTCPAESGATPQVTFTFRSAPANPALARASVRSDVGPGDNGCDAMAFWIRGKRQMPLVNARHFLQAVGRLLGVRLTTGRGY